jgi:hypothetical protein
MPYIFCVGIIVSGPVDIQKWALNSYRTIALASRWKNLFLSVNSYSRFVNSGNKLAKIMYLLKLYFTRQKSHWAGLKLLTYAHIKRCMMYATKLAQIWNYLGTNLCYFTMKIFKKKRYKVGSWLSHIFLHAVSFSHRSIVCFACLQCQRKNWKCSRAWFFSHSNHFVLEFMCFLEFVMR